MATPDSLKSALAHPNIIAFLRVIRTGEGTRGEQGYRTMFGGGLFDSFADHPRRAITRTLGGKPITSTAAGAYQFLSRTWDGLVKQYGFTDFSPLSQDLGAVALISGRGALRDVLAGNFREAVERCNREWASLPGSPYGQPTLTWSRAWAVWETERKSVADMSPEKAPKIEVPEQEEHPMPLPALVLALLPQLVSALPSLAKIVSRSDGESVTERNVKLAEKVGEIVTEATGAAISDSLLNGYLSEGQRTNYGLYSRDFTNAAWVKTNVTAALDQTGIDGRASSASKLTASAANGTALQSITRASAQRVTGFYVKRVTGTGTVEITQDNGTTWTAITGLINGTTYTRVATAAQTMANPVIGFRIVTSGDAIAVDAAQHEEAAFISSPIPTTSASATRNADDPALTPWAGFDTEGAAYLEFTPSTTWANSAGSYGLGVAGADRGPIKLSGSNSGVQALDGTNTANGPAGTPSGRRKLACRWGATKMRCFANNSAGTEANYDGSWNASELEIGRGNSLNAFGATRNVKAWKRAPADAYLQGLTAP